MIVFSIENQSIFGAVPTVLAIRVVAPSSNAYVQTTQNKSHCSSPSVFHTHLLFLGGGEIIFDVEGLSDLLGGLAFDHVGHLVERGP